LNYLRNKYISRHFFENLVALLCETQKFKNVAIALLINHVDDKAVPNFYDNFVTNRFEKYSLRIWSIASLFQ